MLLYDLSDALHTMLILSPCIIPGYRVSIFLHNVKLQKQYNNSLLHLTFPFCTVE